MPRLKLSKMKASNKKFWLNTYPVGHFKQCLTLKIFWSSF